jgi:hypothetical protein
MLDKLMGLWRAPRIDSAARLRDFLDRNAAQLAQRTVIGYCMVKTRLPISELATEKQFAEAYDRARWESFAAVLADLVVVAEGYLRPAAVGREVALADRLAALYRGVLEGHPVPAHRPQGWSDATATMRARLAEAQQAPPRPIADVALVAAEAVFAALPIHSRLSAPDKPAMIANVQFLMVGLAHEFEGRFAPADIVADLLGAPSEAGA